MPKNILPRDKYNTFKSLMTYPLPTVEYSERAYEELHKVFQADNKVIDYIFDDKETKEEFIEYLDQIGFNNYFETEGWERYKTDINGMIIIDLPPLERDEEGNPIAVDSPEPYFYFLESKYIHYVENDEQGACKCLFYWQPISQELKDQGYEKKWCAIDSMFYHVYLEKDGVLTEIDTALHGLGYTPARMFWSQSIGSSRTLRSNQLSDNLGAMDWLLYTLITERHLELYAGFPIISVFEQECSYRSGGFYCENGYLYADDPEMDVEIKRRDACPNCNGEKALVGPGSIIEAPGAANSDSPQNQMPMINITTGDTASLSTMRAKIDALVADFMINMIGYGGDPNNDQAMNVKQVMGSFESRATVLNHLARGFEEIHKFVADTIADLKYGEIYKGSNIFYGSVFFLQDPNSMQETYAIAKKNGVSQSGLAEARRAIGRKTYQNNYEMLSRMELLTDLEPLDGYTIEEIMKFEKLVSKRDLILKVNFNDFIQRFELENMPVQNFRPEQDYSLRVTTIRDVLMSYVDELQEEKSEAMPDMTPKTVVEEDTEETVEVDGEDVEDIEDVKEIE